MNYLLFLFFLSAATIYTINADYCPGQTACFSFPYYWCCGSDQTCGGFRRCQGGMYETWKYIGIGCGCLSLTIGICCWCIRRQRQNTSVPNRTIPAARNPGVQVQGYSMTNGNHTPVAPNSNQPYTISVSTPVATKVEAVPPASDSVTVP